MTNIIHTWRRERKGTLRGAGDVTGKTIVDISNPVTPDYSGLALGFTTSAATARARRPPCAR
jgi:8-hydroxy-5-deazaflavin:NADPH oxidoreductase